MVIVIAQCAIKRNFLTNVSIDSRSPSDWSLIVVSSLQWPSINSLVGVHKQSYKALWTTYKVQPLNIRVHILQRCYQYNVRLGNICVSVVEYQKLRCIMEWPCYVDMHTSRTSSSCRLVLLRQKRVYVSEGGVHS